jgi:hypothetical protein
MTAVRSKRSQAKSGVRSNGEPAETGNQDKRGPRTNGAPSSLPSLNIRIVGV